MNAQIPMKNTEADTAVADRAYTVTGQELLQFVNRIENLEAEKREIAEGIKEVFAELKGRGFDVKAVRSLLKERKLNPGDRAELEAILDLYRNALGMI